MGLGRGYSLSVLDRPTSRYRRKIAPFVPPAHPGDGAGIPALAAYAQRKAASLNSHVLGHGPLAEHEWAALGLAEPDLGRLRRYRLGRVRNELARRGVDGIVVYDPINVRYATDSTNMQVWTMHNAVRYAFVATDGPVIVFDFHNCEHLSAHLESVDEIRPGTSWCYFDAGQRSRERSSVWAAELVDLLRTHGRGDLRLAVDRVNPDGLDALRHLGVDVQGGEEVMEQARSVKGVDELLAMRRSIAACEAAMGVMQASLRPGMTENDLWAILHAENVRRGGEWIETRLLSSGPRTNPWFQECSSRVIEDGDLVAFDTDLVGPYGYCCDVSRTWLAGDRAPTAEQRRLHAIAEEQLVANTELLWPGRTFRELSERGATLPVDYLPNRYSVLLHGTGLCDEYPAVPYPQDFARSGYDGELVDGMVVSVESYVGRVGGREGVKLEDQVLITAAGAQRLSTFPFDRRLSGQALYPV
ncbi:Xaa-Pro peptidase family protein [soil metagenome]